MRQITLENIGPIQHLTIPIPEDGGVVVLRGRNGVGKTWALKAVDALVSGRGQIPTRDGAAKGVVEGFGVKLTIGRSTRRTGELEVLGLEGRLDISQLVNPPIKDAEAADRQRIKALIQLSGIPADPRAFRSIIPDGVKLEELYDLSIDQAPDPVSLAGQIKRALEAEARRYEKELENAAAELKVLLEQLPDGLTRESVEQVDEYAAQAALQNALVTLHELETRRDMAARQAEQQAAARTRLAELERHGLADPSQYDEQLAELERDIAKLEQALAIARERREQLRRQRDDAARLQRELHNLKSIIEQPLPQVTDEEIAVARAQVEAAKRGYDKVKELLQYRAVFDRIDELRKRAERAEQKATSLRSAAHATDEVLSSMVAQVTDKLWVQDGRLVCRTDRGVELYSDLSFGEQWRLALEIFVKNLGKDRLIPLPQEAWEGLDPINRLEIGRLAREVGVTILTAEADFSPVIYATVLE